MKNIRLIRVDDRLIHGQVVTSWITQTGSKKIMIIDDELYENEFLKDVFAAAAPRGIPVEVMNVMPYRNGSLMNLMVNRY